MSYSRQMSRMCGALVLVALLSTAAFGQTPTIIYVDDDAPLGGDGMSWVTAFRFLSDAVAAAGDGTIGLHEIRVAEGIYFPDESDANPNGTGFASAWPMTAGVEVLRGGFGGLLHSDPDEQNPSLFETVLSGDLNGDDIRPGFENYSENSQWLIHVQRAGSWTIEGFIFEGGYNPNPNAFPGGAAIVMLLDANPLSEPIIRDCTFIANWAAQGAGAAIATFRSVATDFASRARVLIESCRFLGNQSSGSGGAISLLNGAALIRNCVFSGNFSIGRGGAIHVYRIDQFEGPVQTTIISNSVFFRNSTSASGGSALSNEFDMPASNVAHVVIENSVLWTNNNNENAGPRQVISESADLNLTEVIWNVVQPVDPPALGPKVKDLNNIYDVPPDFVDPIGPDGVFGTSDDDYHLINLGLGMTLVDIGNNTLVPSDLLTDLDGNERILDGDGDGTATVDIGANEFVVGCPPFPPDLNGDGIVNVPDLLMLLANWGESK